MHVKKFKTVQLSLIDSVTLNSGLFTVFYQAILKINSEIIWDSWCIRL